MPDAGPAASAPFPERPASGFPAGGEWPWISRGSGMLLFSGTAGRDRAMPRRLLLRLLFGVRALGEKFQSGKGGALLRRPPLSTARARFRAYGASKPLRALRVYAAFLRSAALRDRLQEACIRARTVPFCPWGRVPCALAARGMSRRTKLSHQCSHSSGEDGRRLRSKNGFPQYGHLFSCLASRERVPASSVRPCPLRRRFSQYPARSGSSGDDRPLTTTCRRMLVQA